MSDYSILTNSSDSNIRNVACLLENAHEAFNTGEISLTDFRHIADDLIDMLSKIPDNELDPDELERLKHLIEG